MAQLRNEIITIFYTLLSAMWRFFIAVCDWRTHVRFICGQDTLDVVFITNMRDDKDRKNFLGKYRPTSGHFSGPRYWIKGIAGRTRALDCTVKDFKTSKGREKVRHLFENAVEWANIRGVKVILLAASTKRLFNKDEIKTLKNRYPNIIFTLGDNGTNLILKNEAKRALMLSGLKDTCRIGILGVYGFLGEMMTKVFLKQENKILGIGRRGNKLLEMKIEYGIDINQNFCGKEKVDAVITCTHSSDYCLNQSRIEKLRIEGKKLLVIDVAEPSNLKFREYQKCKDVVIRQDAGNAYSPFLIYVLGFISYKMFRLSKGVTFGCFAESLALCHALKEGDAVNQIDWFKIDDRNMAHIESLFFKLDFKMPTPRCFSKKIQSFDLSPKSSKLDLNMEKYRN